MLEDKENYENIFLNDTGSYSPFGKLATTEEDYKYNQDPLDLQLAARSAHHNVRTHKRVSTVGYSPHTTAMMVSATDSSRKHMAQP